MPDIAEHPQPTPGDGRRLTYAQIADRLGISGDAARILVRRRGWQRILPNHPRGLTVVVVPDNALASEDWRRVAPTVANEQATAGDAEIERTGQRATDAEQRATAAEQRATDAERRADEANMRTDAANKRADGAIALVDQTMAALADANARTNRAEAAIAGERQRADRIEAKAEAQATELRTHVNALQTQLGQAQAAVQGADDLRAADDARKAMSRWGRAWRAWRGR